VQQEVLDLLVQMEALETQDRLARQAILDLRERQDLLVQLEALEAQEQLETQDPLARQVIPDPQVQQEVKVSRDRQVSRDLPEEQVLLELVNEEDYFTPPWVL
jgi:hypothetical protein